MALRIGIAAGGEGEDGSLALERPTGGQHPRKVLHRGSIGMRSNAAP